MSQPFELAPARAHPRRQAGFTLIELMIVVAIVAILAAIAYASYDWAVVKSRRNSAAGCTLEKAQYLERFYTTNLSYSTDRNGDALVMPAADCENALTGHYTFGTVSDAGSYTVTATPQGHQATADDCGALSVDETGAKAASTGTVDDCW